MKRYFLFLTLLFPLFASAQTATVLWENIGTAKQELKDAILLPDGHLAIVGVDHSKAQTMGFFLLVDSQTGELLQQKTFANLLKDSGFNAIAEADDGSFYLVGYTRANKKEQKGWLVRIDEKGNKISEKELGNQGESELLKITWLTDGTGLVAGYKERKDNGNIWLLSLKDGHIQKEEEIGTGAFKEITGLVATADGKAWICGNTKKMKGVQRGDIWLAQIDKRLYVEKNQIIGDGDWQLVNSLSANYLGDLLLGGLTYSNTAGDSDGWLLSLDGEGQIIEDVAKVGIEESQVTAVLKTANGQNWFDLQTMIDNAQPDLINHQIGHLLPESKFHLEALGNEQLINFRTVKLLQTASRNQILLGNDLVNDRFKIICLEGRAPLATKSLTKLTYRDLQFYFEDDNADECFSAGERGAIRFKLTNAGTTDISEGKIELSFQSTVDGLAFPRTFQYLPYLIKQTERIITFPVVGMPTMQAGNSKLQIKVNIQNRPSLTIPVEIESIHCPKKIGSPIKIIWQKPDIITNRTVRTVENQIALELSIVAPRILKSTDAKIYKSSVLIEDEKNQSREIAHTNASKEGYLHRFKYKITDLQEGENIIHVEIDGYKSDAIIVNFEPRKPNLHVLAIGPVYESLKYPAKDARDFVNAIKQQYNADFFGALIIDTLTTKEATYGTPIKTAFEKLKNRFINTNEPDFIAEKDYVIIFISGHGENQNGRFRFIPSDYKEEASEVTSVDYENDIIAYLNQINCKKMLFIDACLSGAAVGRKSSTDNSITKALLRANSSASGTVIFTSCSETESSFEYHKGQNGVFTEALLEAVSQQSVQLNNGNLLKLDSGFNNQIQEANDSIITIGELYQFLAIRVPDLLQSVRSDYSQTPSISLNGLKEDLPVFVLKK